MDCNWQWFSAGWSRWAVLCVAACASVAQAAGGEGETPSLFTGDLGNAVWTLLIFLLVVFTLGKFAWKPLLGLLQKREDFIRDSLAQAKEDREKAERVLAEHQAKLDQARAEASAIVEEGRRDAEVLHQKIKADAKDEGEAMIARARREIELARDSAVKELFELTTDLATDAAGRIIHKELSPAEHSVLVQESIRELRRIRESKQN